jgi:hypothetical protein
LGDKKLAHDQRRKGAISLYFSLFTGNTSKESYSLNDNTVVRTQTDRLARSRRSRWKHGHGLYSGEAQAEQKLARELLRESRELLNPIHAAEQNQDLTPRSLFPDILWAVSLQ